MQASKPTDEWAGGKGAGGRMDGRVDEVSGQQGGATGLTEGPGGLGSLGDSGSLACWVGTATACQGRLRHGFRVGIYPNPKQ